MPVLVQPVEATEGVEGRRVALMKSIADVRQRGLVGLLRGFLGAGEKLVAVP